MKIFDVDADLPRPHSSGAYGYRWTITPNLDGMAGATVTRSNSPDSAGASSRVGLRMRRGFEAMTGAAE